MSTILVVEDTELLRRIYTDKLTQEGYDVIQAANGLEAIAALHEPNIDLVLLDLIMPQMSGLEALEHIKADPRTRDIPVLILSNLGQEQDIERGIALGAIDYLIKNEAKPADVAEKIRAHTRVHERSQRNGRFIRASRTRSRGGCRAFHRRCRPRSPVLVSHMRG